MEQSIREQLELLEKRITEIRVKDLELERMKRAADLLEAQAGDCRCCGELLETLARHVDWLSNEANVEDMAVVQINRKLLKQMVKHLQKSHSIFPENHYTGIGLALGTAVGISFGLTLLNNLPLGIVLGLSLGVGIGSWLDARARNREQSL